MHEESIYEKGNGKNRGIDPLHKVVSCVISGIKVSGLDCNCGDPPMAAFFYWLSTLILQLLLSN